MAPVHVLLITLLAFHHQVTALFDEDTITEELDNGCTLVSSKPGAVQDMRRLYWDMPLPHLNCSGSDATRFQQQTHNVSDIKGLSLSYNSIQELHVDDLSEFKSLQKIDLRMNSLSRVVASKDEGLVLESVIYISFTNNKLTEVPSEALRHFPNLKYLILNGNQIRRVRVNDFKYSGALGYLNLGPNPIEELESGWMEHLNLTTLSLKSCTLTEIPKELAEEKDLIWIDLSDNDITEVRDNSFHGCTSLVRVELAANRIHTIQRDAFAGAPLLKYIYMSDNHITMFQEGTFRHVSDDLHIEAYENKINCNCQMKWFKEWSDELLSYDPSTEIRYTCHDPARNHMKRPRELSADDFSCLDDDISYMDCDAQSKTPDVTPTPSSDSDKTPPTTPKDMDTCPPKCTCYDENGTLYSGEKPKKRKDAPWRRDSYPKVICDDAGYTKVPSDLRADIQMLVMKNNNIDTLKLSQLKKYPALKNINLKWNNIRKIESDQTLTMESVKLLNLRYNKITSISNDVIKSFPNLETFAAYHNQIKSFPDDLFENNRNLKYVYLGPNPIKDFKDSFLYFLPGLTSLSLRNMSLTQVPSVFNTMENLTWVDLSDNHITVVENGTFTRNEKLYAVSFENNDIVEVEENAFNGAHNLRRVTFSENKIKTLTGSTFNDISEERLNVDLWENDFMCDCKMKSFKVWIESMNAIDPTTDVRFRCMHPKRMWGKVSDELSPEDFICEDSDKDPANEVDSTPFCKDQTAAIAISCLVTFVVSMILAFLVGRCTFHCRYGKLLRYAKARQSSRFDDEDEIIHHEMG